MGFRYYLLRLAGVSLFLLIIITQASLAQGSGIVKGTVTDKSSKELLPGANIVIKGTGIGTTSDINGSYLLHGAPAGRQTLVVSYLGYATEDVVLTIPENGTLTQNFVLTAKALEGEVVVITAQAQGQLQAINQQLSSNKIVNIVSEAKIQELPDFNAAAAISRLPGISTLESSGEATKVVIRGLSPQYNLISVGGVALASTGSSQIGATSQGQGAGAANSINNDRSVDISMITPYMIKTIEVFKSLTPDMNANAIGGVVNMNLREAPSGFHTDFLWQSGYTDKGKNYGNYRTVTSASDRFFEDALGVYLLGNAEKYDRDADNMTATYNTSYIDKDPASIYNKVRVNTVQLNRHFETRQRYGGNLILDYRLPAGILRSINMFSRLRSDYKDYNEVEDFFSHNLNFSYRQGLATTDIAMNSLEIENDFGFMSMDAKVANTYSLNSNPYSPFFQFSQTGGVYGNTVPSNVPPESLASGVRYDGTAKTYLSNASLFSSQAKENNQIAKANFKIPLNISNTVSGFLKFGGEYKHGRNTNDQSTPYFDASATLTSSTPSIAKAVMEGIMANFPITADRSAGKFPVTQLTSTNSKVFDSFLDDKFGRMFWGADPTILTRILDYVRTTPEFDGINASSTNPGGWFMGYYQTLPNDYVYTENYGAGYLMSELAIDPGVLIVGGVRYEDVSSTFQAYNLLDGRDPKTQSFTEVTVKPKNNFLLPMVQIRVNPVEWADVRFAYGQTLARPDFYQLSPHYNIDYSHMNVWAGNPNLVPAQSFNQDLILTLHGDKLGMFSVGGFTKKIEDFTYYMSYKLRDAGYPGFDSTGTYGALGSPPKDGATLYTYKNNPNAAYVTGLELDWQTRLWYLPFPLDGIVFGANYTRIWSHTKYVLRDEVTHGIAGRPGYYIERIDSTREGRLVNQPNDIANAFIGYDYRGFSGKVSFIFQGNSVSSIGQFREQDGFTDDYYRIDVSIRQKLPLDGLQVFLDVNNTNNRQNIARQISIGGFTNQKNYGLTANIGVRYAFSLTE